MKWIESFPSESYSNENEGATNHFLIAQVHQMFPDYPLTALIDDLRRARSLDSTVENILDGRLSPEMPMFQQEPGPEAPSIADGQLLSEPPQSIGDTRFDDSPEERQQLLQSRKRDLLATARLRFMHKQTRTSSPS